MSSPQSFVNKLITELGFTIIGNDRALGQVHGIPTALTLLGSDPLAVMFAFRINSDGHETSAVKKLLEGIPEEQAKFSFENGVAWLSFYDLEGADPATIRLFLEQTADAIESTDLRLPTGCLKCGSTESVELLFTSDRPARICATCLQEAAELQRDQHAQFNRASLSTTLTLPGACLIVAIGWAFFWTVLDFVLEYLQLQVIVVNRLTVLLGLCLFIPVGYVLGVTIGKTLRQSLIVQKAPVVMSILFVSLSTLAGEVVYLAILLLRLIGVFDLKLAFQALGLLFVNYSSFWIICKAALLITICVSSSESAKARKAPELKL